MASKLNKKFIAILAGALLFACIGIAGIAFFIISGDANRAYERAIGEEKAGNLVDALSYIGRAIGKDPSNQSYYDDYERILLKMVPETEAEAIERYQRQYIPLKEQRISFFQGDAQAWMNLLQIYVDRAMVFQTSSSWESVVEASGRMLEEFPEDGEANRFAHDLRLLAMSKTYDLLKFGEQDEFDSTLDEALESEDPSSVIWEIALGRRLKEAVQYKNANDSLRFDRVLSEEDDGFDALFNRFSNSGAEMTPGIRQARIQRMLLMETPPLERIQEEKDLAFEHFTEVADRMLAAGPDDLDMSDVNELRLMFNIGIIDPSKVRPKTFELFEAGLLPLDLQLMYATTYITDDSETSSEVSRSIIAAPRESVGLMSMVQPLARRDASIVLFDSAFNKYSLQQVDKEPGTTTLSDVEANAQIVRDQFAGISGLDEVELYLDGSIAVLRDDMSLARAKLSELQDSNFVRKTGIMSRFLPRLIIAYRQTGEGGAATEILADFLSRIPLDQVAPLRLSYAVELLNQGRKSEAAIQLNGVLSGDPGNENALKLLGKANEDSAVLGSLVESTSTLADRSYQRIQNAVSEGRLEDALKMAEALNAIADEDATKNLVALLNFRLNRFDEATRILESMEDSETNLSAQQLKLLMSTEDPIERLRLSSAVIHEDAPSQRALFFSDLVRYLAANPDADVPADQLVVDAFTEATSEISKDRDVRRNFFGTVLLAETQNMGAFGPGEMTARALDAIRAVENDEVELVNTEAVFTSRKGDYLGSLELLDPLIKRGIASEETYILHSLALENLGRNTEAIESMRLAFNKAPSNVYIIKQYANLLESAGEREQALELLRNAVLAPVTRGLLLDQWLSIEADIGDVDVALAERKAIYQSDLADSIGMDDPIINLYNATKYAQLLMTVTPNRIYILDSKGEPRFSPNAWGSLGATKRRELLSECRQNLRKRGFTTLDTLEKNARNQAELRLIRLARAESYRLVNDNEMVVSELNRLLDCCEAELTPIERLRVVSLASGSADKTLVYEQLEKIAASEDLSALRMALEAGLTTGWDGSQELSRAISEKTGQTIDRLAMLRLLLNEDSLDQVRSEIADIRSSSEYQDSVNLRFELLLFEAEIELGSALEVIQEYNDTVEAVGLASMSGDTDSLAKMRDRENTLRAQILSFFRKGIALCDQAIETSASNARPYLRKHTMLQALNELQHSDVVQADMIANAKLGRDINPMSWASNSNLVRAYMISGQGQNALQTVDQYLRRGGSDPLARSAMTQIARSERTPGLAVPAMKIAMKANPSDPAWPRDIAVLLLMAGDAKGAAEMWWNVIELDKSPEAIEAFIDLEFRQDEPNLDRLDELFKMAPDVIDTRPVLSAAKAFATSMRPGQGRRAQRQMSDAYVQAKQMVKDGEPSIIMDRVLAYFFKMNSDASSLKQLSERLQTLVEGPLGPHELAGLAAVSFDRNMFGGMDLVSGAEYLERAIELTGSDVTYKKALMQQLSTVLYSAGRCADAIKVLTELVEMGDEQPSTLNNLAYMIIECENDPAKALGYSTQAIRDNRNVASYLDTHGYILFRIGDLQEAFRNLNRSVILQPSASNLLNLAEVYEALDQRDKSLVMLQRLEREFPQLSDEKQKRAKALLSRLQ
ncbi:MAG TPA: hypothetical protein DCX60_03170 [Phycisphaerales bacterium]|nr:hypothetical protein [Phycisphaerales bacterium]